MRQRTLLTTMTGGALKTGTALLVVGAVCVSVVTAQPQSRRGGAPVPPGGRGGAPQSDAVRRVQTRSYLPAGATKKVEYAEFVSTKVKKDRKSSLVIALHGAGVPPEQMLGFVADAAQDHGYIVFAPMGYSLEGWYGIQTRLPPDAPPNLPELSETDVMHVLEIARSEFAIDDRRIYLLGQSMGGAGALYLGVKHQEVWAAVGATAPAAGPLSPTMLDAAAKLPMILVHGDADERVPVAQTRRWVERMRELKMPYEYIEIPGAGHRDAIILGAARVFAFFDQHARAD